MRFNIAKEDKEEGGLTSGTVTQTNPSAAIRTKDGSGWIQTSAGRRIDFVVTAIEGVAASIRLDDPIQKSEKVESIWKSQGNEETSPASNALY